MHSCSTVCEMVWDKLDLLAGVNSFCSLLDVTVLTRTGDLTFALTCLVLKNFIKFFRFLVTSNLVTYDRTLNIDKK